MNVIAVRTAMSGEAVRSRMSAIVENAAVPTNSDDSSTARTNRRDRGVRRSSNQSAANAPVAIRIGTVAVCTESRRT
jgi:hypothetical protein